MHPSYTVNSSHLSKTQGIRSARISVTQRNLYIESQSNLFNTQGLNFIRFIRFSGTRFIYIHTLSIILSMVQSLNHNKLYIIRAPGSYTNIIYVTNILLFKRFIRFSGSRFIYIHALSIILSEVHAFHHNKLYILRAPGSYTYIIYVLINYFRFGYRYKYVQVWIVNVECIYSS